MIHHLLTRREPTRIHGGKEPFQDHSYRTLRHGLRHLHGIFTGEKPLRRVLCTGPEVPELYYLCLQRRARQVPSCIEGFPCWRLKQLDRRYRTKYHMSMLENLAAIIRPVGPDP